MPQPHLQVRSGTQLWQHTPCQAMGFAAGRLLHNRLAAKLPQPTKPFQNSGFFGTINVQQPLPTLMKKIQFGTFIPSA